MTDSKRWALKKPSGLCVLRLLVEEAAKKTASVAATTAMSATGPDSAMTAVPVGISTLIVVTFGLTKRLPTRAAPPPRRARNTR